MPPWPISRSISVTTTASCGVPTPIPHNGAVPHAPDVSEALLRPRARQPLSLRPWQAAPQPTLATQIVAARPHRALDHAFERSAKAIGRGAQAMMLKRPVVNHDALLLGLLLTTCAAVGGANMVYEICRSLLDRAVDGPMRQGIDDVGRHVGLWASVPLAVTADGAMLLLALAIHSTACLAGVIVGTGAALGAMPFLLCMPVHLRKTLADGLRTYLALQQRLAAVERLMNKKAYGVTQRLSAALDRLQPYIDALTYVAPPQQALPPTHMHFHFIKDLMAEYPNAARRLGLPRLLSAERLQPVKESLWQRATQRRRSDTSSVTDRKRFVLFGVAS